MGSLVPGLTFSQIKIRVVPNEGIRRSARNAVFGGLSSGLVGGLICRSIVGPIGGVLIGLIIGVFVGLIAGGEACIKHVILRLWLVRNGWIPWNYVRFLDHAVEQILLRNVGGGYSFFHRMLLDYFATCHVGRSVTRPKPAVSNSVETETSANSAPTQFANPVWVWGVPFAAFSALEAITEIETLVESGRHNYVFFASTHYVMLTNQNPDLRMINASAAFILPAGAPIVLASRWTRSALQNRVLDYELIPQLSDVSARKGYRLVFVGNEEGVADEAARDWRERFPGVQIVGSETLPSYELPPSEMDALIGRIRDSEPHLLLLSLWHPYGLRWIYKYLDELRVPVSVVVDFAAVQNRRVPNWVQKCGLEWALNLALKPRARLEYYLRTAWFIVRMIAQDIRGGARRTQRPF